MPCEKETISNFAKGSAPFISVLLLFSSMRYSPELHRSQSNEVTLRNVTFSSKGPPIFQKPLELDLHDTINALRRLFERRKSLSLSRKSQKCISRDVNKTGPVHLPILRGNGLLRTDCFAEVVATRRRGTTFPRPTRDKRERRLYVLNCQWLSPREQNKPSSRSMNDVVAKEDVYVSAKGKTETSWISKDVQTSTSNV